MYGSHCGVEFRRDIVARLDSAASASSAASLAQDHDENETFRYSEIDLSASAAESSCSLSCALDRVATLKGGSEVEELRRRACVRAAADSVSCGVVEEIWTHLSPLFIFR